MSQQVSDNAYFSAMVVLACIIMVGILVILMLVRDGVNTQVSTEAVEEQEPETLTVPAGHTPARVRALFSDAGRGDKRLNPRDVPETSRPVLFEANVSAYCPCSLCCGIYADGITASGHVIQPGDKFVAAPKHIPFGTMIDIPGYGRVPVLDRGGAIKGDKLDVYMEHHSDAINFGRQYLQVTLERRPRWRQ